SAGYVGQDRPGRLIDSARIAGEQISGAARSSREHAGDGRLGIDSILGGSNGRESESCGLRPHVNTITAPISKAALQQGAIAGAADLIVQGHNSPPASSHRADYAALIRPTRCNATQFALRMCYVVALRSLVSRFRSSPPSEACSCRE